MQKLAKYNKFWIALLGAIIAVVVQFFSKNPIVMAIAPILTALGVHQTPNAQG